MPNQQSPIPCDSFCQDAEDESRHHIKVGYQTSYGGTSKAYVDHRTGKGTNKYTDETVIVRWDDKRSVWIEVSHD